MTMPNEQIEGPGTALPWLNPKTNPRKVTGAGILVCTALLRDRGTTKSNAKGKGEEAAAANAAYIVRACNSFPALVEALEGVAPYLNTMLVEGDPDDETVGWEADGDGGHSKPIDFTMGQIRKVNAALLLARGDAPTQKGPGHD